jgi:hypothetical protein
LSFLHNFFFRQPTFSLYRSFLIFSSTHTPYFPPPYLSLSPFDPPLYEHPFHTHYDIL